MVAIKKTDDPWQRPSHHAGANSATRAHRGQWIKRFLFLTMIGIGFGLYRINKGAMEDVNHAKAHQESSGDILDKTATPIIEKPTQAPIHKEDNAMDVEHKQDAGDEKSKQQQNAAPTPATVIATPIPTAGPSSKIVAYFGWWRKSNLFDFLEGSLSLKSRLL